MRDDDGIAVLELDLVHVPGAAWGAAAQRVDLELQFVAGLERLAGPAVANEAARGAALKAPDLGGAVLFLDFQNDEGVRGGVLPFLYDADEIDGMLLVEHGER